ncbi:TPR repeat-containing protein [Candidatus Sulfopaludibacter sp. SbA3]|nr:TPR repeat-containing protein [Candidatus Sulfopaludibacter sp. SbA3]
MRERLVLLTAALLAFGASLGSGFHFDDYAIFADPALNSPRGWLEIWTLRQTRPLTYLTFWINTGHSAFGFHALNLALHLGAVMLAYECLRRLLPQRAALLAAAIFGVHPLQAESVDYVWGRSIVLASLLCLASLLAWLRGARWQAVAWFLAALLAKEEVAAFPLMMLLLNGKERRAWPPIATMCMLSLAAGVRVVWALAVTSGAPAGVQAGISPWHYFLAQGVVIWRYLRLMAIPWGFTVDPEIAVPPVWLGLAAWAALAAVVVLAWRREAGPWILAGLLLLLPSSSLFPAADLAADRRMYLPLLAFAAAGVSLWNTPLRSWLGSEPRASASGLAIVLALLTGLSFARTQVWASDESLWREAVRRAPDKVRPKIQLARAVPAQEALQLLAAAKAQAPDDPNVAMETGKVLLSQNQPAAALSEFGRALALNPRDAAAYNNRGAALAALGQADAARQDFERALRLDPTLLSARQNLQAVQGR